MLSGKKENEGLLNESLLTITFESPLTITFFWCTDQVISVHPKLKTWKKSCLLILPSKPHGTPENSVVFPNERAECLEPSVNKNFSIFLTDVNHEKMSTNLKSHACMLTVCICVCVCETEREGERINFPGNVLEQLIDVEFLYPLDPHFQWSLMCTFVMRQGY